MAFHAYTHYYCPPYPPSLASPLFLATPSSTSALGPCLLVEGRRHSEVCAVCVGYLSHPFSSIFSMNSCHLCIIFTDYSAGALPICRRICRKLVCRIEHWTGLVPGCKGPWDTTTHSLMAHKVLS